MPRPEGGSLKAWLARAGSPDGHCLFSRKAAVKLRDAVDGTCLGGRASELTGCSVLIAVADQLSAALALIELDGLARRLILCPPDIRREHLPLVIRDGDADAIVCSDPSAFLDFGVPLVVACGSIPAPAHGSVEASLETQWLMLTSGTTGVPKIAVHTLKGLTGAIKPRPAGETPPVWATFYDIRRYGGLQIFLRAMLGGGSLVLSDPDEAVADHLRRLASHGVTHISGTPTHWRRALLTSAAAEIAPAYVRLSGEIADRAILDSLKSAYPRASVGHAYASTEAGVGFEVNDGLEGFPANALGPGMGEVELKIVDGSLLLRSARMASHYAGRPDLALVGADGFVDSGDMVDVRGNRCYFAGRRDGVINVGGLKVHPEEIETVINRHAAVRQSRAKARKSPVIGAIVVAEVVLRDGANEDRTKSEILALCRDCLPAHKVPAVITIIAAIETTAGGKLARHNA